MRLENLLSILKLVGADITRNTDDLIVTEHGDCRTSFRRYRDSEHWCPMINRSSSGNSLSPIFTTTFVFREATLLRNDKSLIWKLNAESFDGLDVYIDVMGHWNSPLRPILYFSLQNTWVTPQPQDIMTISTPESIQMFYAMWKEGTRILSDEERRKLPRSGAARIAPLWDMLFDHLQDQNPRWVSDFAFRVQGVTT